MASGDSAQAISDVEILRSAQDDKGSHRVGVGQQNKDREERNQLTLADSSAEIRSSGSSAVVEAAKQHKIGLAAGVLIAIAVFAAAAYGIYSLLGRRHATPFENFTISQLTTSGKSTLAAISPDGKYLLTVVSDKGKSSLWLRHIQTNSDTQIVPPRKLSIPRSHSRRTAVTSISTRLPKTTKSICFACPCSVACPRFLRRIWIRLQHFLLAASALHSCVPMTLSLASTCLIAVNPDGTDEKVIARGLYSMVPAAVAWSWDRKTNLRDHFISIRVVGKHNRIV